MSLGLIFIVLFVHWLADFIAQSHEDAINKSSSNKHLLSHTVGYTAHWAIALPIMVVVLSELDIISSFSLVNVFLFLFITFVCHTVTDYFTSRLVKRYFSVQNFHNGFVVVGFDQILHYVQLFLCIKYLIL